MVAPRATPEAGGARRRLMRAAALLIAESGSTETTVQRVASTAGVSTKTFYQHFADKDAFFYEFWKEQLDTVAAVLASAVVSEQDPLVRLRLMVEGVFAPDALPAARGTAMYHSRLSQTAPATIAVAHRPLYELLVGIIEEGQQVGAFGGGEPRSAAAVLLELMSAAARAYYSGAGVTSVRLGPDEVFTFCARSLGGSHVHFTPPPSSSRR